MSKHKRAAANKPDVEKEADYYKLNKQAVADLVNADESNSPEVSEEELRKYRSGHKFHIAEWVKIVFIKAWFAGAVCFFFIWGLGTYMADMLDSLFVTGIALGVVTDLLTNNVLRFFEKTPGANSRWMMWPQKGFISFPLNILHGFVVLYLVYVLYNIINLFIVKITGMTDTIPLAVGPIFFGIFCMLCDLLLIKIKHFICDLFHIGAKTDGK